MRRILLAVVWVALGTSQAMGASYAIAPKGTAIRFVNTAHVSARLLHKLERAVVWQANTQLRHWWHTPRIRVAPYGEPVYLLPATAWLLPADHLGFQIVGEHPDPMGEPMSMVLWDRADVLDSEVAVSHEVVEMLVDPTGHERDRGVLKEIADPVENDGFMRGSIELTDFVTPAWFRRGSRGPWDAFGDVRRARDLTLGR